MQDNRDSREFIYNDYFFSYDSVYSIRDKLRLEPAPEGAREHVAARYRLFSSVGNYVYNNDRLIPHAYDPVSGP